MGGKRGAGNPETSKKAAGQARKAEAAANKKAVKEREEEQSETQKWDQGSKDTSKKEAAANKAAEAARKKAERAALEAEEMASLKSAKTGNAKSAWKKGAAPPPKRGLDLAQLDDTTESKKANAITASGIDDALDALSLAGGSQTNVIDRHPERRFKAAYAAFEERKLEEMKDDKTLRRQQKIEQIRKEFEKSPDNPFNQVSGMFNSTKDELVAIKDAEKDKIELRLANPSS